MSSVLIWNKKVNEEVEAYQIKDLFGNIIVLLAWKICSFYFKNNVEPLKDRVVLKDS